MTFDGWILSRRQCIQFLVHKSEGVAVPIMYNALCNATAAVFFNFSVLGINKMAFTE